MTQTTNPTPPPGPVGKGPNWARRGLTAAAVAGLLLTALVTSGTGSDQREKLETGREQSNDTRDVDLHTPRPSGDESALPAPAGEPLVTVAPDMIGEVAASDAASRTSGGMGGSVDAGGPAVRSRTSPTVPSPAEPTAAGEPIGPPAQNPEPAPVHPSPDPDTDTDPGPDPGPDPDPDPDPGPTDRPVGQASTAPPIDQVRCPSIDLHAIGDLPENPDAEMVALAPRFRAMAAAELERDDLVCANPIERWRGIVIQRLFVAGQPDGTITAHDEVRPLVRFSDPEWRGYRFLPDYIDINLSGAPLHREHHADHSIVRTTRGGLVSRRADTHGFLVVNGAWTMWADQNGRATMGFPETQPALSTTLGIYQDFANGWLQIPGVHDPFVAETLGPEAYVWHPVTDPHADVPADSRGNILEVNQTSWFIDRDGVRHWIPDTREYSCARSEHGARKITVRGWVVATFPIGEPYACATG